MADKIELVFFRTEAGNEPVREWLKSLPEGERRVIGQDLQRLQYRWPVGMPLARALSRGIWEVRSNLPGNKIARVLFCFDDGSLVALHGFVKKTRKTPPAELDLALDRKRQLEE